jgi:hypothetical protein
MALGTKQEGEEEECMQQQQQSIKCALIIDKLFSLSVSGPAQFWAGVLCGRYHTVRGRAGGGGDGSLICVKASGSGHLRPRNQRSFGSVYVDPSKKIIFDVQTFELKI